MKIGAALRHLRQTRGWSQEAIAMQAGMSQGNYSNLESNKQQASQEQIAIFAKIFNIQPLQLLQMALDTAYRPPADE